MDEKNAASRTRRPKSATAKTPTLSELQDRFQAAILSGDEAALADIMDNSRTSRDVLFGVYRNGYSSRLVEIIGHDHGLLHAYLGDEGFDGMARAYVAAHPSRTQNARWVSRHLPDFLAVQPPYREHPQIADLARIEAALSSAFDAPDGPVVGVAELSLIPPERWENLRFVPHPSAFRLNVTSNAFDIWSELRRETSPPDPLQFDAPMALLVWRQNAMPMIRALDAEEAMMWDEACKGTRFGALCELAAMYDRPDQSAARAAGYLGGWLAAGLITSVQEQKSRRVRAAL